MSSSTYASTDDVALVLANVPGIFDPHPLIPVIQAAATTARHRLTIVLFSPLFSTSEDATVSRTELWDEMQRLLGFVYVQATKVAQDMGKILLDVDVLLKDPNELLPDDLGVGVDVFFVVEGCE
jgi:hypothetical protein